MVVLGPIVTGAITKTVDPAELVVVSVIVVAVVAVIAATELEGVGEVDEVDEVDVLLPAMGVG